MHLFLSMHLFVCDLYVLHAQLHCLFLHHHCLLNPLSHYYCHALLNMCPYCYLIHGTKYFRGGTEYFIFSAEIFSPGDQIFHLRGQNWGGGGQIFNNRPEHWVSNVQAHRPKGVSLEPHFWPPKDFVYTA